MAAFNEFLTKQGEMILAKMAQGKQITFTKCIMGDGILKNDEKEEDITEVIHAIVQLGIDAVTVSIENVVSITSTFDNTAIDESFYFREKAIYATDGEQEVLVFYANNGVKAELIEPIKTQLVEKKLKTLVKFKDSDNVNITVSKSSSAPAPIVINNTTINEFIESEKVNQAEEGTVIIINDEAYIFKGGDATNIEHYISISNVTIERKWEDKEITISKNNDVIISEYESGKTVTTIEEENEMSIIMEAYYNKAGEVVAKYRTTIRDNKIILEEVLNEA